MMGRAKRFAAHWYIRIAPSTVGRAVLGFLGAVALFTLGAGFLMGIAAGASNETHTLAEMVSEVAAIESTIWSDMGEASPLSRAVYGPFHWLTVLATWISVQGLYVGVALPEWLHSPVAMGMRVFPWVFVGYGAILIVRLLEIAVGRRIIEVAEGCSEEGPQ